MGFDDFFEHGRKHHSHGYNHHHEHDDYYQPSHSYKQHSDIKYQLLSRLKENPNLKKLVIFGAIFFLFIILIVVVLLLPLLLKLFEYISQNGIQGLIESIWKGSK